MAAYNSERLPRRCQRPKGYTAGPQEAGLTGALGAMECHLPPKPKPWKISRASPLDRPQCTQLRHPPLPAAPRWRLQWQALPPDLRIGCLSSPGTPTPATSGGGAGRCSMLAGRRLASSGRVPKPHGCEAAAAAAFGALQQLASALPRWCGQSTRSILVHTISVEGVAERAPPLFAQFFQKAACAH